MRRNVTGTRKRRRIFWPAAAAAALTLLAAVLLALGWYALRGRSTEGPLLPHLRRPAQRHVVAVDAGHGGADVGAKGLVDETAVTQATAAALLALLEADGAYAPVQVHTDDTAPSPQQMLLPHFPPQLRRLPCSTAPRSRAASASRFCRM